MEELEECSELFTQDGVLLNQASAKYMPLLNSIGTVYVTEAVDTNHKRFIVWKQNDMTVDSDVQDQEWAVVNTVQKRFRTLSGNLPPDYQNNAKYIKMKFEDIKSFRVAKKNRQLTFFDGKGEDICSFIFQHGDCEHLVGVLKTLIKIAPAKRDKHWFVLYHSTSIELEQLNKSFAELDLKCEGSNTFWNMFKNIKENPREVTFEAFSKVTDYVYRSADQREFEDDEFRTLELNKSITEYDDSTTHPGGDYELIQKLPARKEFPRLKPLSEEMWHGQLSAEGRLEDVESIQILIFRGGVSSSIRQEVWKFLLDYYPWDSSLLERRSIMRKKHDEYYAMKLQWKSMSIIQEAHFTDYRERKSLIEKDVNRTDRTLDFYAGDNNANLQTLNDILMTYMMYNFDLGYVQGMSDLLSPILLLLRNETDAFWCFVGFMNKLSSNFDVDQAGMKEQLNNLHLLLSFVDPQLANYLDTHDSGNMFFCFRWLLVWFKRELSQEDLMRVWEVLWTGFPCENFHLLVCVAILETERKVLVDNGYGFTEILKHINDLNGKLDMAAMLNKAEGIFYQIKEAEHLTDDLRLILGLPLLGSNYCSHHKLGIFGSPSSSVSNDTQSRCLDENVGISPDEAIYEKSINSSFL